MFLDLLFQPPNFTLSETYLFSGISLLLISPLSLPRALRVYTYVQYTYRGDVHLSFLKRKKRKHISQRKPTQKCTEHYTYTIQYKVHTFSLIKYKFFRSQKVYYEFMTERTEEMCLSFSYATAEE